MLPYTDWSTFKCAAGTFEFSEEAVRLAADQALSLMQMSINKPLVSIGMPLYNEEKYLHETFDCLLNQDYENFEIVISDNASTDRTPEICRERAAKDARIHYTRLDSTVDASENMNRVVNLAHGSFYMWASGHDRHDPRYISACLKPLLSDPSTVLCYTEILPITAEGQPCGVLPTPLATQGLLGPVIRYLLVFWNLGGYQIHGLFRSESLKSTKLFRHNTIGPDFILLGELAVLGSFAAVREPLYSPRIKWLEKNFAETLNRYSKTMFIQSRLPRLPHWRLLRLQLQSILQSQLSASRKLILAFLFGLLFFAKYRRDLFRDLIRPKLRQHLHSRDLSRMGDAPETAGGVVHVTLSPIERPPTDARGRQDP